ncbi:MAG TPA: YwiC-like family protein [Candidatus Methylomirabilis sp.]|nr:YwiC-like family protein [Candidatus Methylomirabilis sp.]
MEIGRPIVPKEHGAWAVIYGAFLAGVGVAGQVTVPVILFLVGVTAAALANGPFAILARVTSDQAERARRQRAFTWLLLYGAAAVLAFGPLLTAYRMTFLLPFGMGAIFFLLLRAFLVRERDDRTLGGELIGTAGLSMVGPAAHAVAVGAVRPVGAVLWLLLFLFFASGVFYVRMRIRGMVAHRRGAPAPSNPAVWSCVGYHVALFVVIPSLVMVNLIPWLVLLAFAPALWRAAAGLRREETRLNLRRLGWSEVAVATAFVFLLIAAFRFVPPAG